MCVVNGSDCRNWGHWMDLWDKKEEYLELVLLQYKLYFSRFDTLVFYGGGCDAHLLVDFLEDILPGKEVFFVDRNPEKHGNEVYKGIICYGIEKIKECKPISSIVIIATSWYANEIYGELSHRPWESRAGHPLNKWLIGGGTVENKFIKILVDYKGGWNKKAKKCILKSRSIFNLQAD